jgi:TRAP-type C4-dicarboxylate transport system permease small subunit
VNVWKLISEKIAGVEKILLSGLLTAMILLVLTQIILRNFFNCGIIGGVEIVRHLVLWIAFVGAGLATREGRHVRIDMASRILSTRGRKIADIASTLFSVVVCTILFVASCKFVYMDYINSGVASFLNVPIWIMEAIIPVGYLIVTIRFSANAISALSHIAKGEET